MQPDRAIFRKEVRGQRTDPFSSAFGSPHATLFILIKIGTKPVFFGTGVTIALKLFYSIAMRFPILLLHLVLFNHFPNSGLCQATGPVRWEINVEHTSADTTV